MILDTGGGEYSEHHVIHELYHLIEYRYRTIDDRDWERIFGSEGYAGSYAEDLMSSAPGSGGPGFVNAYSRTFPHEDRAELFMFMILEPEALARIMDDTLEKKTRFVIDKCHRLLMWQPSFPLGETKRPSHP